MPAELTEIEVTVETPANAGAFAEPGEREPAEPEPATRKPAAREPAIGETTPREIAGRYLLCEEIGRGGMGIVHLGRTLRPPTRLVAIKRLYPHLTFNPRFVAMFVDEARLAARVEHPNVVAALDLVLGEGGADLYVVMDYVHGETLAALLSPPVRGGPPSIAVTVAILAGALRALQAVHEARGPDGGTSGIVHGDVSPQNIMVGVDGQPRLLDFGAARIQRRAAPGPEGAILGKPAYLAPEQLRGEASDHRADIFAAGVMAWETLARRRLFRDQDVRVVRRKILSGEIPSLRSFNDAVPPMLEAAVARAMASDPAGRQSSALAFAEELEAAFTPAGPEEVGEWVQDNGGAPLARRSLQMEALTTGSPLRPARRVLRWARFGPATGAAAVLAVTFIAWTLGQSARAISPTATEPPVRSAPAAPAWQSAAPAPALRPPPPLPPPPASRKAPLPAPRARIKPPLAVESAAPPEGQRAPVRVAFADLVERGIAAHQRGDREEARRALRAAITGLQRRGLGRHHLAVQAHLHLGLVFVAGFGQRELGIEEFKAALKIDRHARLDRPLLAPTVAEAFLEAQGAGAETSAERRPLP